MRHVPISGVSWRVTLVAGICTWAVFIISEEELLLGSPSVHPSFISLLVGNPDNYLLLLGQFSYPGQRPKAQHVILGLYPYIYNMKITWFFILFSLYNFGFLPSHSGVAPMRFFILFLGEKEGSICDVKFQWLFAYLPVGVSWNRQGINKIERHFE